MLIGGSYSSLGGKGAAAILLSSVSVAQMHWKKKFKREHIPQTATRPRSFAVTNIIFTRQIKMALLSYEYLMIICSDSNVVMLVDQKGGKMKHKMVQLLMFDCLQFFVPNVLDLIRTFLFLSVPRLLSHAVIRLISI